MLGLLLHILVLISTIYTKNALVYLPKDASNDDKYCSLNLGDMLTQANFNVKYVSYGNIKKQLKKGVTDVIAFPGSNLDTDTFFNKLTASDVSSIISFVRGGGRYLGVCMGAFMMGKYYFGFVNIDYQDKSGRSYKKATLASVSFRGTTRKIYIEEPPEFGKMINDNQTEIISYFTRDNSINIFLKKIGKGKVAGIASHPEADESWSNKFTVPNDFDIGVFTVDKLMM
jgi:anthranilate/para-aminobenzoate synthase component II